MPRQKGVARFWRVTSTSGTIVLQRSLKVSSFFTGQIHVSPPREMRSQHRSAVITYDDLTTKSKVYDSIIPKDLRKLEDICRKEVPEKLAKRKNDGKPYLDKAEVTALMDWKL